MGISRANIIESKCNTCGKPFEVNGIPALCDCERKSAEEQALDIKAQAIKQMLDSKRKACFRFPAMYEMNFSNSENGNAKAEEYAHRFVDMVSHEKAHRFGMVLSGPAGTGKTFLAACIANAIIDKRLSCKFTKISEVSDSITDDYGKSADVINALCSYDCVILDDFGADISNDKLRSRAYEIIDALYMSNTPFIITTNLSPDKMTADRDNFNVRTYSRIFGACVVLSLAGHDRRRDESKEIYEMFKSQGGTTNE